MNPPAILVLPLLFFLFLPAAGLLVGWLQDVRGELVRRRRTADAFERWESDRKANRTALAAATPCVNHPPAESLGAVWCDLCGAERKSEHAPVTRIRGWLRCRSSKGATFRRRSRSSAGSS
jgi:hypothetical protein